MNHIDRMLDERSEIVIKVNRLQVFIGSDIYKELNVIDQELLVTQRYVMHQYIELLTRRIDRATHGVTPEPPVR